MEKKELTLFVNFIAEEGSADFIKSELLKLIQPTRAEKEYVKYVLHTDNDNKNSFFFYEIWEDYDAWQKHRKTDHMQNFYALSEGKIAQRTVYQSSLEQNLNIQKIIKSENKVNDDIVTVIAVVKAKEGCKDALYAEFGKLIEGTHKEAGCIDYILHTDNEDENTFLFYENWQDAKALEEHGKSAHMLAYVDKIKDCLADVKVYKASVV